MFEKMQKFGRKVAGFTLTEVMIGMMILTVAIVSATNLLIGLISSNQNNLTTLQAYYLAQEGLEAVRNIRDTNWLHNQEWLGEDSEQLWRGSFLPTDDGESYAVNLEHGGFDLGAEAPSSDAPESTLVSISSAKPWSIDSVNNNAIFRNVDVDNVYLGPSKDGSSVDTGFKRTIIIKKYDCSDSGANLSCDEADDNKYVLVESKVEWKLGAKERELTLSEVLTDWKGGAL